MTADMPAKTTIKQLLERGEIVWSPCIYDCVSARVAELCGYNWCCSAASNSSMPIWVFLPAPAGLGGVRSVGIIADHQIRPACP